MKARSRLNEIAKNDEPAKSRYIASEVSERVYGAAFIFLGSSDGCAIPRSRDFPESKISQTRHGTHRRPGPDLTSTHIGARICRFDGGDHEINHAFLSRAILLSFGCAPPAPESTEETPAIDLDSERDALMAVDKAWSETVGDIDAFLSFFADGAHFMPFGAPLAQGDAIRTAWEGLSSMPGFGLEWQATSAEVAASGDIGYAIGTFELTADQDDTAMLTEGKYVTVWHKEADSSWKVQIDCFNANGPPTAAEG